MKELYRDVVISNGGGQRTPVDCARAADLVDAACTRAASKRSAKRNVVSLFTVTLFVVMIASMAIAITSCERGGRRDLHTSALQSQVGDETKLAAVASDPGSPGDGGGGSDIAGGGGGGLLDSGEIAGPLGEPQSLLDEYLDHIEPWGPVIAQIQVEVAPGQYITVNRLSSPDPFTGTYQLPSGTIVVTNEPLENIVSSVYTEPPTPTMMWEAPSGNDFEVAIGQMLVTFEPEVTQEQIVQFIADHELYVVFSWFEPPEEQGMGNAIAWFQFRYDEDEFSTMDEAFEYFSTNEFVAYAQPNTMDQFKADYAPPNDLIYNGWYQLNYDYSYHPPQARYVNLFGVDSIASIPYGPERGVAFSSQMVAVIDTGVYRNHTDLKNIYDVNGVFRWVSHVSNVGVNCDNQNIWVDYGLGEPTAWDSDRQGLISHGTRVAGVISCATNNVVGTASLAPNAKILPIRVSGSFYADNKFGYSNAALVKAIRALRFNFYEGAWYGTPRVVNMSFSSTDPIHSSKPHLDFEWNLNRDLSTNDRLYVGSAGNDSQNVKSYPAAFANVLGVTGLWTNADGTEWLTTFGGGGSNYFADNYQTYPVSGIYDLTQRWQYPIRSAHMSPAPPGNMQPGYWPDVRYDLDNWYWKSIDGDYVWAIGIYGDYEHMNGTSACAPQVASLAFHLYRIHPDANYRAVRSWIVYTRDIDTQRDPIAGVADFDAALSGW